MKLLSNAATTANPSSSSSSPSSHFTSTSRITA